MAVNESMEKCLKDVEDVIKEIGFDRFMENLRAYEDGVDWKKDSHWIAKELFAWGIDPLTFCY